ncbi:hypothetical protein P9112_007880 [Eukaryota sp. TZLM1-RC]
MKTSTANTSETVQQPAVAQSSVRAAPSQVLQDLRPLGVTPFNTHIARKYSNSLLMVFMAATHDKDRDRQRSERPRKPTVKANDISDSVKILQLIFRFILYAKTEKTIEERNINESDPTQVSLAKEMSELRKQLKKRFRTLLLFSQLVEKTVFFR